MRESITKGSRQRKRNLREIHALKEVMGVEKPMKGNKGIKRVFLFSKG
jgi:hypothetical protein